ncbi:Cytochrome [Forsythia ovata]|uniref:Cytochrome n=1 Tax=Forsythia ovata TaxID=205694 RepID=A0ABD1WAN0_9LAMI
MRSQGLKGPSYRFIHGNTKEIINMTKEATSTSMEFSHDLFPRIQPHLYSWMKLYGKNFLFWKGHKPQIIVSEPELIKEILGNKNGTYRKSKVGGYLKKLLGDGLVAAEGQKWLKQRKLADHAFHGECLKLMVPAMISSVQDMLEKWRNYESKEIEVWPEIKILTSEVISRTAFGSSYQEGKNIFEMITKLSVIFGRNANKIQLLNNRKVFRSQDDIESEKLEQSLRGSVLIMIKKREHEVTSGRADNFGNDFLGSLLTVHHDADQTNRISVDDMVDECKTFYLAGHETTSTLLSWIILILAVHMDWQEKARKEVLQLFGHENPTSEGIARLKTVSMIINETIRLYSPVLDMTRRVNSKVRLGKYELPANIELHIPPLALHRNPEIWGEDAYLFKPERFAEGVAKATKNNPIAFLPFGYGPHTCVGLNFATNEVKIALSMILQQHKFTLSPNYVHSPIHFLTVQPQHGIQIMLHSL